MITLQLCEVAKNWPEVDWAAYEELAIENQSFNQKRIFLDRITAQQFFRVTIIGFVKVSIINSPLVSTRLVQSSIKLIFTVLAFSVLCWKSITRTSWNSDKILGKADNQTYGYRVRSKKANHWTMCPSSPQSSNTLQKFWTDWTSKT